MERTRRYKQNIICLDGTVLGHYRTAFYNGQNVALHAFARYVRAVIALACDFIYFVYKYNSVVFGAFYCFGIYRVVIDKLVGFFRDNQVLCFPYGNFTLLFLVHTHTVKYRTYIYRRSASRRKFKRLGYVFDFYLYNGVVVFTVVNIVYKLLFEVRNVFVVGGDNVKFILFDKLLSECFYNFVLVFADKSGVVTRSYRVCAVIERNCAASKVAVIVNARLCAVSAPKLEAVFLGLAARVNEEVYSFPFPVRISDSCKELFIPRSFRCELAVEVVDFGSPY